MKTITVQLNESHIDEKDRAEALEATKQCLEQAGISDKVELHDDSAFGRISIVVEQSVITGQVRSLLYPVVAFSILGDDANDISENDFSSQIEIDTPLDEK